MRLKIENFAKIKNADIIIDGITVIAGENNTGKSTVGKILFSLFNSISGIEEKVEKQRIEEIQEVSRRVFHQSGLYEVLNVLSLFSVPLKISNEISEFRQHGEFLQSKDIHKIIRNTLKEAHVRGIQNDDVQDAILNLADKIYEILNIPEASILFEVLSVYFNRVFNGQINSLTEQESDAAVELDIKGKKLSINFTENKCRNYSLDIRLLHQAIYIDNPFIVDKLSGYGSLNIMDEFLKELLTENSKEDMMAGIFETVLAKEKLTEIYKTLQSVVDGRIIHKQDEDFFLEKEGFKEPVSFNNLSTGLKSFVILKMLLEKGLIKEKDVLVLDEPEIHLHPQWQITYAELIVLLQKHFDLSIIVTTHSPYFLDAINLFSVKHGINEKTNYYLSSMEDGNVSMDLVTDHIDTIFKKMATPIQALDSLRYELNNN